MALTDGQLLALVPSTRDLSRMGLAGWRIIEKPHFKRGAKPTHTECLKVTTSLPKRDVTTEVIGKDDVAAVQIAVQVYTGGDAAARTRLDQIAKATTACDGKKITDADGRSPITREISMPAVLEGQVASEMYYKDNGEVLGQTAYGLVGAYLVMVNPYTPDGGTRPTERDTIAALKLMKQHLTSVGQP